MANLEYNLTTILAAITGGSLALIAAVISQYVGNKHVERRESLARRLDKLESIQSSLQMLSRKWHEKIDIFHQKSENRAFDYLNESYHPGDEKFQAKFLIRIYASDGVKTGSIRELDSAHKALKMRFEAIDNEVREKARAEGKENVPARRVRISIDADNKTIELRNMSHDLDSCISKIKEEVSQYARELL